MSDEIDYHAITWPAQLTKIVHRSMYPLLSPSSPHLAAYGRTVLITGASGGIGSAIAEAWAVAGAKAIIITGRRTDALNELKETLEGQVTANIESTLEVLALSADITKEEEVQHLWTTVAEKVGRVDVLINNAGSLTQAMIGEKAPSSWWNDFEVNVKGVYLNVHYFLQQGSDARDGTIISVGTGTLGDIYPNFSSYIPSKLAQTRFMEFLHEEQPGVRCFSIFPGLVATEMPPKQYLHLALDDPMLTGGLTLFLCTQRAEWMRGRMMSVNWDIEELEMHREEVIEKKLTKLAFTTARFGKGGHPWEGLGG